MKTERAARVSHWSNTAKGWAGAASVGAAGFAALVMLMAPMAAATSVMFAAPFAASGTINTATSTIAGFGGNVLINQAPLFTAFTGAAQEKATVSVVATNHHPGQATVGTVVGMGGLTYSPTSSEFKVLKASWIVGYQVTMLVKLRTPAPVGTMMAGAQLLAKAVILDKTTGKIVPGGAVTINVYTHAIVTGSYATVVTPHTVLIGPLPVTLQGGHVYSISTTLTLVLFASAIPPAVPGALVTASFALAPTATLHYVTLA